MVTVLWQTKSLVNFTLKDKHVNEHCVIQKSHDATQVKCPHVVHFNVPHDWFETNSQHQKCTLKVAKNFVGVAVY